VSITYPGLVIRGTISLIFFIDFVQGVCFYLYYLFLFLLLKFFRVLLLFTQEIRDHMWDIEYMHTALLIGDIPYNWLPGNMTY
jgi:hypothetical protein